MVLAIKDYSFDGGCSIYRWDGDHTIEVVYFEHFVVKREISHENAVVTFWRPPCINFESVFFFFYTCERAFLPSVTVSRLRHLSFRSSGDSRFVR